MRGGSSIGGRGGRARETVSGSCKHLPPRIRLKIKSYAGVRVGPCEITEEFSR